MAKELQKKEEFLPAVIDFDADAGSGFEDADSSAYAIPFLRILQAMSPQIKKSDASYIKGAEEGDIFNTVSESVIKAEEGITIIPCAYEHIYLLWAPGRAGLRGRLSPDEYIKIEKRKIKNDKGQEVEVDMEGNIISDTRQHYVLIVHEDGNCEPALISMSSTQIKKSKKWMSLMQAIRHNGKPAPMFSQTYKVTTVTDPPNDKGTWMGWKIEHTGQVPSVDLYNEAKSFRQMVRSGAAKATPVDSEDF